MTSKSFRRATTADVPVLTQIRNDAHAKKVAHGDYAWGREGDGFSERWVLHHVSRRDVYLVELDCTPVATFTLDLDDDRHWQPQEPDAGYVHGLCVRKGFNGGGLGGLMIDWCASTMVALNRCFIRLDCDAANTKLCAYYESLGFVRVGLKPIPESGDHVASLYQRPAR